MECRAGVGRGVVGGEGGGVVGLRLEGLGGIVGVVGVVVGGVGLVVGSDGG